MRSDLPAFDALEELASSPDIRDRAFAAGVLSLRRRTEDRERVAGLYGRIRDTARNHQAEWRRRICNGTLDRRAFIAELRETPLEIRDHLVEEILDVAYPPLEETPLPSDAIPYCPSGLAEVLFMLENADLRRESTFVDLGAGLGKVVLLVAVLTGARVFGVEIDPRLVSHARSAARALNLDAQFVEGDLRDVPLPPGDVYYMYSPLIRPASVVARLGAIAAERRILLFSSALDLTQHRWLSSGDAASYWLEKYESSDPHPSVRAPPGLRPELPYRTTTSST